VRSRDPISYQHIKRTLLNVTTVQVSRFTTASQRLVPNSSSTSLILRSFVAFTFSICRASHPLKTTQIGTTNNG
jgi:hypothetical protein